MVSTDVSGDVIDLVHIMHDGADGYIVLWATAIEFTIALSHR